MKHRLPIRILSVAAAAAAFSILLLSGCKDFSFFSELGIKGGLKVSPSQITIVKSSSVTFAASGGNPPYTFEVVSGSGCIDPATGYYTAPDSASTEIVMAVDSTGQSGTATVSVVASLEALAISPNGATVPAGSSITFVATGGVGPYEFSMGDDYSGGSITPAGVYTAGFTSGVTDTVVVSDLGDSPTTYTINVNVTAVSTNVDYDITADTFPAGALTASSISGGFTITNSGSATGTADISWWLFISEDGVFGGAGEHLVDSGSVSSDIPASGTHDVSPTGTWPADLAAGGYTLFVMIASPDDLNHANNVFDAGAFTLSVPQVDYRVLSVSNTGGTRIGGAIDGEFSLDNAGADDGTADVTWKVYVSANTTVDVGDTLIDSYTHEGAMTSIEAPRTINFSGTWPSAPDSYYLVVEISAPEDTAAGYDGDNTTATDLPIDVAAAEVDHYADTISAAAGIAGGAMSCDFLIHNGGGDHAAATVTWNLYASANDTLDGGDFLAASGNTVTALDSGTSTPITPSGADWPSIPGSYYLIVEIESAEDTAAGNDGNDVAATAAPFAVTAPQVDYTVTEVNYTGGGEKVPGQPFTGQFKYGNNGILAVHDGTRELSWTVYASLNPDLDVDDVGVASGNGLAPLGLGATSNFINFDGVWPLDYGEYYLIVKVSSLDDEQDTSNDYLDSGTPTLIGVYTEGPANDEYETLFLGAGGFDILYGENPTTPIVLQPGMSIKIEGTDIDKTDDNDTFMFNAGTANTITFTLSWSSGSDDLEIWVYEEGDPAPALIGIGGLVDLVSASILKGPGTEEFSENQPLWFNVYYRYVNGSAGAYTAIIMAN